MKPLLMMTVVAAAFLVVPEHSSAQHVTRFGGVVVTTTVNGEQIAGVGGGAAIDLMGSWVSVGGQADLLTKNGYIAGRGGPIAQANLFRRGAFRVFGIGGVLWGVEDGPLFGGGVEVWSAGRLGFRATVHDSTTKIKQDYRGTSYTKHRPSFQLGVAWR